MSAALPLLNRSHLTGAAALDLPETVVQFGTGAFLRGFIGSIIDDANRRSAFGRIVAVASTENGGGRHRSLEAQDGLFTLITRAGDSAGAAPPRIISSISRTLSAATEWEQVLELARSPQIGFVFSNTTEVGIGAQETGARDAKRAPATFPGKLTSFLYERAVAVNFDVARGVVVIPCELINDNGDELRRAVLKVASGWSLGARFVDWLRDAVPFCNTLVDRIVPSVSGDEERAAIERELGYRDALITLCEPYRLFAIQANAQLRPRLTFAANDPTITLADDVTPYRLRKLHLLNGPHTIMAAMGLLAGKTTVVEAMSSAVGPVVRQAMMAEIVPHLAVPDAAQYANDVIARFSNPAIKHALLDIMLYATTKTRVRIVPLIVSYCRAVNAPPPILTLGFANLLVCYRGDLALVAKRLGRPVPADEGAGRIAAAWQAHGDNLAAVAQAVTADVELWGMDLSALPGFTAVTTEVLAIVTKSSESVQRVRETLVSARG